MLNLAPGIFVGFYYQYQQPHLLVGFAQNREEEEGYAVHHPFEKGIQKRHPLDPQASKHDGTADNADDGG